MCTCVEGCAAAESHRVWYSAEVKMGGLGGACVCVQGYMASCCSRMRAGVLVRDRQTDRHAGSW